MDLHDQLSANVVHPKPGRPLTPHIDVQANYAAANAALDAYAAQQVARGTAAVAVQWGAWSSVGEAQRCTQYSIALRGSTCTCTC